MLNERQAALFRDSLRLHDTTESYTIELIDLFSGESINSRRVPASIERIPHLKDGLDYLRERHDTLHPTLFASRHEDDVVHSDSELANLLGRHDAYFLEGYGTVVERREIYTRAAYEDLSSED